MDDKTRNLRTECWSCRHRKNVEGHAHIRCEKPDPEMIGDQYGINQGWFFYPVLFDPTWKLKQCNNWQETDEEG